MTAVTLTKLVPEINVQFLLLDDGPERDAADGRDSHGRDAVGVGVADEARRRSAGPVTVTFPVEGIPAAGTAEISKGETTKGVSDAEACFRTHNGRSHRP